MLLTVPRSPTPPSNPAETELTGQLQTIFKSFDNGDSQTILGRLADGRVVRGTMDDPGELQAGHWYYLTGRWDEHARYGWQFAFNSFVRDIPRVTDGAAAYLMTHCQGVGMTTARKLVEKYGDDAVRVVVEEPQRAVEDGLLRATVAEAAAQSLREICDPAERNAHLELFRLFRSGGGGFPRKLIRTCLHKWGQRAPERIRRDPFTLLVNELPGCGFLRCDRLYLSLGHRPDRLKRQALAVWYELRQHDGDTWVPLGKAFDSVRNRIGGTTARPQRAVALGYRAGWLEYRLDGEDGHWISERGKATAEKKVAHHLRVLQETGNASWPHGPFSGLSEHQQEQLATALTSAVAILTGSPGTGKTHTAAAVIRRLAQEGKLPLIAVAAPTGKAAVRITQKLEEAKLPLQATTIHKLLGVRAGGDGGWKFAFDEDTPLPFKYIVVDETSMLDTDLAAALLRACAPGTHLLLVGDVHQLPPVGHGAPLRDLLDAGVPAARLTEIRRNSGLIVESCAKIKDGEHFEPVRRLSDWNDQKNLVHLPARGVEAMLETLASVYDWLGSERRWDLVDDVQVLSARNATRKRLNKDLQLRLNKDGEGNHKVFKVGDKIINLKNGFFSSMTPGGLREYVANGDIGRVEAFRGRQMAQGFSRLMTIWGSSTWRP
jgi:exodeoxyribonuclease V alpha subunit